MNKELVMKKYMIFIALVLLSLFTLTVSCPQGPENPFADITLRFKNSVGRGEADGGYLNFEDLKLEYRAYPSSSTNEELKGTRKEWTEAEFYEDEFHVGFLTPASWVIEIRFLNDEDEVVYYGKSDIEVVHNKTFEFKLDEVVPITEQGSGDIRIVVNTGKELCGVVATDDYTMVSRLAFKYRYNNTQLANIGSRSDDRVFLTYDAELTKNSEYVELTDNSGKVVGSVEYGEDKQSYIISLNQVPYGYYFYYIDFEYYESDRSDSDMNNNVLYTWSSTDTEGASYIYLVEESREKEWNIKDQLESKGRSMEKSPLARFYAPRDWGRDENVVVSPVAHYYLQPGKSLRMDTTLGVMQTEIKVTADYEGTENEEEVKYKWSYLNEINKLVREFNEKEV